MHALLLRLCLALVCVAGVPFPSVHLVRAPEDVPEPEPAYAEEHWALVDFAPVPPFHIDTHASAHEAAAPWDPLVWERIVALSKGTPKGTLFVDVGANIGYFSLMAASLGYTVVSFEPMSRNARKLARSLQRNAFAGHVTLYQNALGAVANQRVVLTGQSLGTGSTYGVDYADTTTLSSAMFLLPMRPAGAHIVKIDVEGMEAAVLAGARDWLCSQAVPYVLIEFSDATRASTADPATEMFAFMRRAGYTVSDVNVQSDTPLDYDRLVAGDFAGVPPNLLFTLSDTKRDPAGCPPY